MTQPLPRFLSSVLETPLLAQTRRNHGLEHATITVLSQKLRNLSLVGRSTPFGFHLYGSVSTEALTQAAHEALQRMRAGEAGLAVHPNCGTNFVTAGLAAGIAAYLGFWRADSGSARRERLPLVAILATLALIAAQPFGLELQRHVTTTGEMRNLRIERIDRVGAGRVTHHFVTTTS